MLEMIGKAYLMLLRVLMGAAAIYLGLMMLAIVYATMFRYLDLSYSGYSFVFIEYGFIYCLMFGAPWIVRQRGHVYIEIATAAVPPRVRNVLSRVIAFLATVVCALFAYYSGILAVNDFLSYEIDVRGSYDIPRWIVTITMPLGFGLMAIEFGRFIFGKEIMHTGEAGVHE